MTRDREAHQRTGSDGRYTCTGFMPGPATVWAQVPATGRYGQRPFDATAGSDLSDFDIELPWAAHVRGRVVDQAARGVADVVVHLEAPNGDYATCPTNASGEFDCKGLAGGDDYTATVHASITMQHAFPPLHGRPPRIRVADGESIVEGVEVAVTLARADLRGRVLDDKGAAFADCHITAAGELALGPGSDPSGIAFDPPTTMSARDGSFEFAGLVPGLYNLAVICPDNAAAERMRVPASGGPIAIEVARAGRITGRLVGFTATPTVHTFRLTDFTQLGFMAIVDGDHFSFDGIPPGEYPVEAIAGEQMDGALVDVKPGAATELVLTARATTMVSGRVVDHESGVGLAGFTCQPRVVMGGWHGDLIPVPQSSPSDASGTFSVVAPLGLTRIICMPPPGPFTVTAGGVDVALPSRDAISVPTVRVGPPSIPGFRLTMMKLPLTVQAIDVGGPAASSGLQVGDHLRSIDGEPVDGLIPISAMVLLNNHPEGTPMKLTVERAGALVPIEIVPAHNGPAGGN